jgi:hypothetical protein
MRKAGAFVSVRPPYLSAQLRVSLTSLKRERRREQERWARASKHAHACGSCKYVRSHSLIQDAAVTQPDGLARISWKSTEPE